MGYTVDQLRKMLRDSGQNVDQYSDWAIGENLGQYNSDYDSTNEILNNVEPEYQKVKKATAENFTRQRTDMQDLMNRLGVLNSGITLDNIGKINKNETDRYTELDTDKMNRIKSLRNKLANINTNYLGRISSLAGKYRQAAQQEAQQEAYSSSRQRQYSPRTTTTRQATYNPKDNYYMGSLADRFDTARGYLTYLKSSDRAKAIINDIGQDNYNRLVNWVKQSWPGNAGHFLSKVGG